MSDLLPASAKEAERALSLAIARAGDVSVVIREVWNPDTCPLEILPWLAWAFSVDEWDANWSEIQKRETIKQSISVHKFKGTIGAVRDALRSLGYPVELQEWFRQTPQGDPYTFGLRLDIDQVGISEAAFQQIIDVVLASKNLRSHLEQIRINVTTKAGPSVAAASFLGSEITVKYPLYGLALDLDFIGTIEDPVSLDMSFAGPDPERSLSMSLDFIGPEPERSLVLDADFVSGAYAIAAPRPAPAYDIMAASGPAYYASGIGQRRPRFTIYERL